ncbi:type IV conjugative transfer system protein TraE [Duganella sp. FT92W]|uniref:Type IV conjugative transfer system protein TraE n=1 Tax=Pseudoduganella rivuli TaxID=2666085 RepID=A0A7X2IIR5_9BURK|nr:type IV conjugative transfer system protein TraE [Pseudoduganella rivuli]
MDEARYKADLKDLRSRNRRQGFAIGGLIATLLLTLSTLNQTIGSVRTVVVPPSITKSFWVTSDKASNEYLEQMGGYMAWLILDVTPSTIKWKTDTLLTYVGPENAGAMKIKQEVEAERLKRLNGSTYFLLQQLTPDETKQSIVMVGRLRTQINGMDTSTEQKSYLAEFHVKGGRMHLKQFLEVPNNGHASLAIAAGDAAAVR